VRRATARLDRLIRREPARPGRHMSFRDRVRVQSGWHTHTSPGSDFASAAGRIAPRALIEARAGFELLGPIL